MSTPRKLKSHFERGRREGLREAKRAIRCELRECRKTLRGSWAGVPHADGGKRFLKRKIYHLQEAHALILKISNRSIN